MQKKTIAIHQPNFMPWLSYFEKMEKADELVVLGHCQYEKNGYQSRFRMYERWYTMSTFKGLDKIVNKIYMNPKVDWDVLYKRLPQFKETLDLLPRPRASLYESNYDLIETIAGLLKIDTPMSSDWPTELTGTDRLVEICKKAGATTYLSGMSGKKYLDESKFKDAGIEVEYFCHTDRNSEPILGVLKRVQKSK